MNHRLVAAIALACAVPQAVAAQPVVEEMELPEAPPLPEIDPATLDEKGLRALIADTRYRWEAQAAAIRELRRRFGSDSAEAFAQNAEAMMAVDAFDGAEGYRRFTKVRATYAKSADPAVQVELARAIQGQAQAQDLIEAGDLNGSVAPVTTETIRLDTLSTALRRELVEQYGGRSETGIRRVVAQERFNLAVSEAIAGRFKAGPASFLGIVRDYQASTDPEVQRVVADVFSTLAGFEADPRRQIAWYDELIRRFASTRDPALIGKVGDALDNKAFALETLGEAEAARRASRDYEEWSRSRR